MTISEKQRTNPVSYLSRDDLNRDIQGAFYEEELLKTKYDDFLLVEDVLQRKGGKSLVK